MFPNSTGWPFGAGRACFPTQRVDCRVSQSARGGIAAPGSTIPHLPWPVKTSAYHWAASWFGNSRLIDSMSYAHSTGIRLTPALACAAGRRLFPAHQIARRSGHTPGFPFLYLTVVLSAAISLPGYQATASGCWIRTKAMQADHESWTPPQH